MNLVKTLAKVAVGVMVARGVGKMISSRTGASGESTGKGGLLGNTPPSSTGLPGGTGRGLGGPDGVGGLSGGQSRTSDSINLPGGSPAGGSQNGGLGGLLDRLTRGGSGGPSLDQAGGSDGSLADILGSVLGGAGAVKSGGGLGDMLERLRGGSRASAGQPAPSSATSTDWSGSTAASAGTGSLGALLNQAFGGQTATPPPEQNSQAGILLRGMLNAAKSDGQFDQAEQQKVMKHLGDISHEERDFVQKEISRPLDVEGFIRSIPRGMEEQVYVMSVLAIELDSRAEAEYLDQLSRGLGIEPAQVNAIHQQVGVPLLYG